jgi:hypothetical protein
MKFNQVNLFALYGAPIAVMLGSQDSCRSRFH